MKIYLIHLLDQFQLSTFYLVYKDGIFQKDSLHPQNKQKVDILKQLEYIKMVNVKMCVVNVHYALL